MDEIKNKDEYDPDIVTLSDDDGKEYTFEVLDAIETDTGRYLATTGSQEASAFLISRHEAQIFPYLFFRRKAGIRPVKPLGSASLIFIFFIIQVSVEGRKACGVGQMPSDQLPGLPVKGVEIPAEHT